MEGTCGKIIEEPNNIVRKVLKRGYKGMSIEDQFKIQKLSSEIIKKQQYKHIFVPEVFTYNEKSFTMEKIDTSKPTYDHPFDSEQESELLNFLDILEKQGYVGNDIECYIQPDGRIGIIDFDKCVKKTKENKRNTNPFLPDF
jgi:RIO-like serine/threonine protein kinase